ncbi:Fe(3+)-transporting ATPase [Desulfotomaculum nigrificans CO-1-SRB]|uniref:Energy-coupling factor transporter ATP-binding protein EcfA2 n=1 Tax=Desulfotomaculum nigrificans (strain DSM 14880 / VKM B-2319 / CO-1-SRB) TaxID=868595 RepID=F6B5S4_DESCC|nr:energy-coupling factor transporter ATPase [Desulfotomaculum nigrificans]AEF93147.1 Fe(3+)-transporting ATPase [Desulfotomaculum nigrificans CO-1-SRB]
MREIIKVENLSLIYAPKTALQRQALDNVSMTVKRGEFRAIIGPQGSGKSSLLQVLAGLLAPSSGQASICGLDLKVKKMRENVWRKVGYIFQYPERQLFEDTVYNDVAYGPGNLGLSKGEVAVRVRAALKKVGMGEEYFEVSPFKLSGGQQRRVAIAGILAMQPEVLLLDEPTAGLDPKGRKQLMDLFSDLCHQQQVTVLLVTHDMEEVAHRADMATVLHQGKVVMEGTPRDVFSRGRELKEHGLAVPFATELAAALKERGLKVREDITTLPEAEVEVEKLLRGRA